MLLVVRSNNANAWRASRLFLQKNISIGKDDVKEITK